MTASIDAIGNVVGRYSGLRPGCPTLLIGSHIDTVRDAGRYDGCLGVVAAIEAVAVLGPRRRAPPICYRGPGVRRRGGCPFSRGARGLPRDRRHLPARGARRRRPGRDSAAGGAQDLRRRPRGGRGPVAARRRRVRLSRTPHRAGAGARGRRPAGRYRHRHRGCDALRGDGDGNGRPCRHRADASAARRLRGGCRDGARGRADRLRDERHRSRPSGGSRSPPAPSTSSRRGRVSPSTCAPRAMRRERPR